jgi:hypothetical protein
VQAVVNLNFKFMTTQNTLYSAMRANSLLSLDSITASRELARTTNCIHSRKTNSKQESVSILSVLSIREEVI